MNDTQAAVAIAVMSLITLGLRALPFLVFREKKLPHYVEYLGKYLPYAMIGMLVVYCLRGTQVFTAPYGIPEFGAVLLVVLLHLWKKNTVLSVIGGTICYMLLIRIGM